MFVVIKRRKIYKQIQKFAKILRGTNWKCISETKRNKIRNTNKENVSQSVCFFNGTL